MAVKPESLLIFRARGITDTKKKKPVTDEKALPKEEHLAELEPVPKQVETVSVQQQIPTPQPAQTETKPVEQPKNEQETMVKEAAKTQQQQQATQAAPKTEAASPFTSGTYARKIQPNLKSAAQETSVYGEAQIPVTEPSGPKPPSAFAIGGPQWTKKMTQQENREAAKGKTCTWHPWREAYSICNYCRRPFCFQDTIELNKDYYCLEDIDNVSSTYEETAVSENHNLSLVAGILLMASFIVFFYFSNAQVLYVLEYLKEVGLPFFVNHINYSYAFALIESAVALISLYLGILLIARAKNAFMSSIFLCLGAVSLFTYLFMATGTLYFVIIDAMIFAAFVVLVFSRSSYVPSAEEDRSPLSAMNRSMLTWPNAGKF